MDGVIAGLRVCVNAHMCVCVCARVLHSHNLAPGFQGSIWIYERLGVIENQVGTNRTYSFSKLNF